MCKINLNATCLNHKNLASNIACYAILYLKNIKAVSKYKYYFDLLESIEQYSSIDQDIIESEIKKLRKTRYQSKVKKGHFYQLDYVLSCIIRVVLETYSDKYYSSYNYTEFKNFLTYPVCSFTVKWPLPEVTLENLKVGNVVNFNLLDNKLKQVKEKEIYMDQYCG